jgi:hypothetical protein
MTEVRGERCYFTDISQRDIIGQVGRFGEELCSLQFNSEIFAGKDSPLTCADLFNFDRQMAIQVRMCNYKHAQRPLPKQVETLYKEVTQGFAILHGLYAFVFYHGVKIEKIDGKIRYKSKIRSKRLSRVARAEILAEELQCIYLIDIRLLRFTLKYYPELLTKEGALVSEERQREDRNISLYVTREQCKAFFEQKALQKKIAKRAFRLGKDEDSLCMVKSLETTIEFRGTKTFEKTIPVYAIGRGDTVKSALKQMPPRSTLIISTPNQFPLQL